MTRETLCDGYIDLMKDLYTPAAYFGRLDALYLDGPPAPLSASARWLRRHPWRRFKAGAWTLTEIAFIFITMMRGIPDAALKREYRRRLWSVVRRRPSLYLLRLYTVKCALHWHFDRLIAQMRTDRSALPEVMAADTHLAPDSVEAVAVPRQSAAAA